MLYFNLSTLQDFLSSQSNDPVKKHETAKERPRLILSPINWNQSQNLITKKTAYCSPPLLLSLPFSPAAETEPRAGAMAYHILALPWIVSHNIDKGHLECMLYVFIGKYERNLKSDSVRIIAVKKRVQRCSRYQDQLILCGTFKSHSSSTATFLQSLLPHTSDSGPLIPQSCNEFKKAFNRPACLDLH